MSQLAELLKRLVGTPVNHEADKEDPAKATIQAPEFDITQYTKKLGFAVGVLLPAVLGVLKAAGVEITAGIVEVSLAVTAAGVLGVSLATAADILGRVYADRSVRWTASQPDKPPSSVALGGGLATVWLTGDDQPHPVVAIDQEEEHAVYLVLRGSTSYKTVHGSQVEVYDSGPTWVREDQVTAFAPEKLSR